MPKALNVILAAFVLAIAALTGTAFIGTLASGQDGIRMQRADAVRLDGSGQYTTIDTAAGYDEAVYNSRGYAVNLTGADDSYVQSDSNINFATDKTWTVSVWARLDSDASIQQRTLISLDGRLIITYYPIAGNWSAWYYDEGQTNSYRVNVSASNVQSDLQNVMVRANGTHLTIYQNNTAGETKAITTENIADAPVSAANWDGRIDEIRTDDDALNNSQRQQLVDSPVGPLTGTNRTARVMFDQPEKDTQLLFFASGAIKQSNVSYSEGLPGKRMDGKSLLNDVTGQTDYVWDTEGPRIYVVKGGELDGAPVAYVDFSFEKAIAGVISAWADMVELAAVIPILAIVAVIIGRVRGL